MSGANFFAQFDNLQSMQAPPSGASDADNSNAPPAAPAPDTPPAAPDPTADNSDAAPAVPNPTAAGAVSDQGDGGDAPIGPDGVPRITIRPQAPSTNNTTPSGQNFFARFDNLRQSSNAPDQQPPGNGGGVLRNVGAGLNTSIADALGAPVDAATWGMNKGIEGVNYAANAAGLGTPLPEIRSPVGGSQSIKSALGVIGANPDDVSATSLPEKLARAAGGGVGAMIAPEAAVGVLGRAGALTPDIVNAAGRMIGSSSGLADVGSSAAIGATGGVAGEGAAELSPPQYQPLARTVSALAGGGVGALATQAPRAISEAIESGKNYTLPMTESGQQQLAGQRIASSAENPSDVNAALASPAPDLVPGSKPTTFQVTGDMGLGSLERDVQTKNPADFMQRRADQNTARVQALSNLQPDGSPLEVANAVRSSLADIDQQSEAAVINATEQARNAAASLGGDQSAQFYGDQFRNSIQPQIDQATQAAQNATQGIGGEGTPEQYGAGLRQSLQEAENTARGHERALWNAVDPDGSMTVSMAPVKGAVQRIYGQNLPAASRANLSPAESMILKVARSYKGIEPFRELSALRSEVSAGMRQELSTVGRSPAYGRLSQLRGAVEDSLSSAVESRVQQENDAVAHGHIAPEQAIATSIQRQIDEWRSTKAAAVGAGDQSRTGGVAGIGARPLPRVGRAARESGGRPTNDEGDQGIPGSGSPSPTFDEAARQRLNAATAATRARAQTYGQGAVGQALRTQGAQGNYRMLDAGVPGSIFKAGPAGFESVQAFRRAVGNDTDAVAALQNYAAASLRRAAERPDGTLDPRAFNRWRGQYANALRGLPGVANNFANAARASASLERFAPFRNDIGLSSLPEHFFHSGAGGADGVQQLRGLVGDDSARGLLSDYAASRLKQTAARADGTLDPKRTDAWLKAHAEALRAFPEVGNQFSDTAAASRAIDDVANVRKSAVDDYQRGALGKLLNATSDEEATKLVGGMFGRSSSEREMGQLAAEARRNPAAMQGLRKATVDYLYGRFVSNTEAATSGTNAMKSDSFQTFIKQNQGALRQVFSDPEVRTLSAIGDDLRRANRSLSAVRIPNQSNTAQDTIAALSKKAEHGSLLNQMILAAVAGYEVHGAPGAVAGVGGALSKSVIGRMRDAGMEKVGDMVKQAMLDPELARSLLAKVPPKQVAAARISLMQQMRRFSMFAADPTRSQPATSGK